MKKILPVLFVVALVITCLWAFPLQTNAATEGDYTYEMSDGKATITDCDESISGDITIPATLGGYPVTTIGDSAFACCHSLTSVTIGDSVTTIDDYAFYGCTSLTSVTIPDSVTTISDYAFAYCTSLTSVTIPDSVTTIGEGAFSYCDSLTSVTIPDSVTTIGEGAFSYCDSLTGIYVSENNAAYSSDDCGVLFNKDKTTLSQAPGGIFGSYTIPDSVTAIGDRAFSHCSRLTSVTIPDSVTTIGYEAFYYCDSLTGIYVSENNAAYSSDDCGVLFNKDKTTLIQAPGGISGSYTIPDSVITIDKNAFCSCDRLTSVTIGDSVTTIDYAAFNDCAGLISVTIGNSVTTIVMEAFSYCDSLTSITIPDSVTTIGIYAFQHCTSLTSVTIGDSVTTIEWGVFAYCDNLTSVTIPDSVTTIGDDAFYWCTSLSSVTISDSVTTIGSSAFDNCTSLTNVYYAGTSEQWNEISIDSFNYDLTSATIHYSHIHDYSGGKTEVAATCTTDGYIEYACIHGETYRIVLPQLGHNFTEGVCANCGGKEHDPGNLDGVEGVNEDDVIYLLQYLLMPDDFAVDQTVDYDKSGSVDEDDVIYLLQHLLMPDDFPLN